MKTDWDKQINTWKTDIEEKQLQSKEQWEAKKAKMKADYDNWQNKVRDDFNE